MKKLERLACMLLCLLLLTGCTPDQSRAFDKALKLFSAEDYPAAAEAFERLGDYSVAPVYAAYSRGLVLYEQARYIEAEPYFAKAEGFMYGTQRHAYCLASIEEAEGRYAEASATFAAVGELDDASLRSSYCFARAAEAESRYEDALFGYEAALGYGDAENRLYNLRGQIYNRAIELQKLEDYEQAISLFNLLGDYLSAADMAVSCKDRLREKQYAEAETLLSQGDTRGAYELFSALVGYNDSAARADDLARRLGIENNLE